MLVFGFGMYLYVSYVAEKTVLVKVLTTDNPPKVIQENLLLADSEVFPHPRYRYFNETNSIVVMHQEQNHRIGHVRRSNFSGKVRKYTSPTSDSFLIVIRGLFSIKHAIMTRYKFVGLIRREKNGAGRQSAHSTLSEGSILSVS